MWEYWFGTNKCLKTVSSKLRSCNVSLFEIILKKLNIFNNKKKAWNMLRISKNYNLFSEEKC